MLQVTEDLLQQVAQSRPVSAKLRQIRSGEFPAIFEQTTAPARAFLVGLLAAKFKKRLWVVCENTREQEALHHDLLNWARQAVFFPETEIASTADALPDPEFAAERLRVLQQLSASRDPATIVLSKASLRESVPSPKSIKRVSARLARGEALDREKFLSQLLEAGYEQVAQVSHRGQFAVRGGILDVFSWQQSLPTRIELFGDEIDSIRQFDLDNQISVQALEDCTLLLGESEQHQGSLFDYFRSGDLLVDANCLWESTQDAPDLPEFAVRMVEGSAHPGAIEDFATALFDHGLGEFDAGDLIVQESARHRLFGQLSQWAEEGWSTYIFCNNEGEMERLRDLIPEEELGAVTLAIGQLSCGFTFPPEKLAILCDSELFGRYRHSRARRIAMQRAREQASRAQIDFSEISEGDYVVHLEHGIGRYLGLQSFATGGKSEEVMVLEFAEEARLYVPLEQSFLVSRYVGVGKRTVTLSSLGDKKWAKARKSAEQAVFDYAAKLLAVHAERESQRGWAAPSDNKWQREFEASFLYKETPDQLTAIAASKTDMESERPMDRLICGDVGFGKTEVAIRAAFKTVMGGRQVAFLVPTTVLAQQHYQTFRERMSDYPVRVEMLSRFRSGAEQRKAIDGIKDGSVDIVIGTHRLISKDVVFKSLGLVVIDEEQRFGVLHKEKFKELFKLVDVLTLSATPIPRTLYLSLMGAKDISVIETPPPNRIPVETLICGYDERIIRDAIDRELARQGQVYFLHNRILSIERIAQRIQSLCPKARVEIGHGQMPEEELEAVMQKFVSGEADVLVSTTIIESGLDIPNANTIIIDRADRFGLADLYQLRGRVGRSSHKAYAFLMLPRELITVGAARKRVNAIKQYSSLGAGFKIAMRDLEIRGAGNVLGTQQSGHIVAVGFELYCQLLKQAVAKLKGEKVHKRLEVAVRLDFVVANEADYHARRDPGTDPGGSQGTIPAFLPAAYVAEAQTRIKAYRKLAEITSPEQLQALGESWRDRFGPRPEAVDNLLLLSEIKLAAAARKITVVEVREGKVMLTRGGDFILLGGKFPRLTSTDPTLHLREILGLLTHF
jgi:transcription-repair coupling factor (superfamily II helicase)